jgi:preprotein translocase subunit SecE
VSQDRRTEDWGEEPEREPAPESEGALDPSVEEFVSSGAADAAAADAAAEAEESAATDDDATTDPVAAARARRAAKRPSQPSQTERPAPVKRGGGGGRRGGGFMQFVRECIAELRRVQWPDRVHLWQATAVVLVTVAVVGFYLYGLDSIFKQASSWLIDKQAG